MLTITIGEFSLIDGRDALYAHTADVRMEVGGEVQVIGQLCQRFADGKFDYCPNKVFLLDEEVREFERAWAMGFEKIEHAIRWLRGRMRVRYREVTA